MLDFSTFFTTTIILSCTEIVIIYIVRLLSFYEAYCVLLFIMFYELLTTLNVDSRNYLVGAVEISFLPASKPWPNSLKPLLKGKLTSTDCNHTKLVII